MISESEKSGKILDIFLFFLPRNFKK